MEYGGFNKSGAPNTDPKYWGSHIKATQKQDPRFTEAAIWDRNIDN